MSAAPFTRSFRISPVGNKYGRIMTTMGRSNAGRMVYKKKGRYTGKNKIARMIDNILNKRSETKQITLAYDTYFNSGISTVNEFYPIIPSIAQNVGDAGRIGQKIQAQYINVKGMFSYEFAVGQSNYLPIYAEVFIFSDKIQRSQNQPAHDFKLLNNSGVATAYNGDGIISELPFNTEEFKLVYRKRIKLSYQWAPGNSSTGLIDQTAPIMKRWTCKIPMKGKILDYESPTAVLPQNTNLWLAVGFTQYSNTTQLVNPLRLQHSSTMYFKDA